MARTNFDSINTRSGGRFTRVLQRLSDLAVAAFTALGTPAVAVAQSLRTIDFNAQRSEIVAQLAAVPANELRRVYLACARESSDRLLEPGEAVVCAMVADTLLAREFNGDFHALIAWWQAQRDVPLAMAPR